MNPKTLIDTGGTVLYFGQILSAEESDFYFSQLLNLVSWKNEELTMFGKHIILRRKVAWYGDEPFAYSYSKTTKTALPWFPELHELKIKCEQTTQITFNSCLLNLYPSGIDYMGWHSDDEKSLQNPNHIASLSLGAARPFRFKNKISGEKISVVLQNGDLLLMKHPNQTHWLHSLPASKRVVEPRINLTFRNM